MTNNAPLPSTLDQFERSYCDCRQCTAACKAMPGMVAPGDLDRIMEFCGVTMDTEENWVVAHFAASEGAAVVCSDGKTFRIPTIVPKQKPNGHCVFLNDDGECTIHPVSPFGCRCFNVCETDPERNEAQAQQSCHALAVIAGNYDYNATHQWLSANGHLAKPLHERKQMLNLMLDNEE